MDAFELRDRLVEAMPDHWSCLLICTVYDENAQIEAVRISPDLSRVEPEEEPQLISELWSGKALFGPLMAAWVAAPRSVRNDLARLLGADCRLSDEDGVTIARTEIDLQPDATQTPPAE